MPPPPSFSRADSNLAASTGSHNGLSILDGIQAALNGVGLIPGLNVPANLISAGISLYQGDYFGAGLSLVGTIPGVSDFTDSIKLARIASKFGCFSTGTKISTPSGEKPIEKINVGDEVWVYDLSQEKVVKRQVKEIYRNTTTEWCDVTIQAEGTVRCTPNHPFWVPSRNAWIQASELTPGMALLLQNGHETKVMRSKLVALSKAETAYNFRVEGVHDYFVGENHILVHNMCAVAKGVVKGSYLHQFESGMKYVGKGTEERMVTSGRQLERANEDKLIGSKFEPSSPNTDEQAFKDEAQKIRANGGLDSGKLYNQINSPGENMLPRE